MRKRTNVVLALGLALTVSGWGWSGESYEEIVDQSHPLRSGGTISLENVNGDVSIEAWEREEVHLYAVKRASSQDLLDRIEVTVNVSANGLSIDTEYPSTRGSDTHEPRFTEVEYTLTVPRGAVLDEIELVNGNLVVLGVEGGVTAETVNGNIVVRDCSGSAALETVNGAIEAYIDRLDFNDELELESVNGRLDLYLASYVSAEIRADSVHGSLGNDFGFEVRKGKFVGSDFSGSIGGGGARVSLETVNGSIRVHTL